MFSRTLKSLILFPCSIYTVDDRFWNKFSYILACIAADFSPFLGQAKEQKHWGVSKKLGISGEGVSKRGRWWGEKESPAINLNHFTELRSPMNG